MFVAIFLSKLFWFFYGVGLFVGIVCLLSVFVVILCLSEQLLGHFVVVILFLWVYFLYSLGFGLCLFRLIKLFFFF